MSTTVLGPSPDPQTFEVVVETSCARCDTEINDTLTAWNDHGEILADYACPTCGYEGQTRVQVED